MKLLILALVGLVAVVMGQESQDCEAEMLGFANCFKDAMDADSEDRKDEKDQHKKLVDQCFSDNDCSVPARKTEAEKECMKDVIKSQIGGDLQECLADRDADVPEELLTMALEGGRKMLKALKGRMGGKGKGKGGKGRKGGKGKGAKLQRKADKHCPNEESAAAVVSCVQELKEERRENRPDMGPKIAALLQCKEGVSEECMEVMKQTKKDVCKCGKSLARDAELADEVAAGLRQCREDDDEDDDEDEEDQKPRKAGRKLRKVFKSLCGGKGKGGRGRKGGRFGKGKGRNGGRFGKGKGRFGGRRFNN